MTDYAAGLEYLFNSSGTTNNSNVQKAYYIDNLVYNYAGDDNLFNANLPLDLYLMKITSAAIQYEKSSDVDNQLAKSMANSTLQPLVPNRGSYNQSVNITTTDACGQRQSTTITTAQAPSEVVTVEVDPIKAADIENYDINLAMTTNGKADINNIITYVNYRIDTLGKKLFPTTSTANKFTGASHANFESYISEITASIAHLYFYGAALMINKDETKTFDTMTFDQKAVIMDSDRIRVSAITNILNMLVPWKFEPLIGSLRTMSREVLFTIATNIGIDKSEDFIKGFSNRANMTNGPYKQYYYMFKNMMIQKYSVDKNILVENDNRVDLFMRKLLIDIYIKTCYPLIHYDFIDTLMKKYVSLGDFVNARFALLAKCMFTYRFVRKLLESATNVPTSISVDFPTNMLEYLKRNNGQGIGSTTSTAQNLKEIIADLHKMSNNVSEASRKTEILKTAITDNQLSMRTLITAINEKRARHRLYVIEFYIVLSMLILVIVSCSVLYFMDLVDIGTLVAGCFLAVVLVYKAIMMIIGFIRRN